MCDVIDGENDSTRGAKNSVVSRIVGETELGNPRYWQPVLIPLTELVGEIIGPGSPGLRIYTQTLPARAHRVDVFGFSQMEMNMLLEKGNVNLSCFAAAEGLFTVQLCH